MRERARASKHACIPGNAAAARQAEVVAALIRAAPHKPRSMHALASAAHYIPVYLAGRDTNAAATSRVNEFGVVNTEERVFGRESMIKQLARRAII